MRSRVCKGRVERVERVEQRVLFMLSDLSVVYTPVAFCVITPSIYGPLVLSSYVISACIFRSVM